MTLLFKIADFISSKFNWLASLAIFVMMALTFIDVTLRYLFRSPITATYDVMGLIALVAISLALGYTQKEKGHISIDFLLIRLKNRPKKILTFINHTVCFGLAAVFSWRSFAYASALHRVGETSATVKIPYAPFSYVMALGFAALALVFIVDIIRITAKERW